MEIVKRIKISGKHWGNIVNLPCFKELSHYNGEWKLHVSVDYQNGKELSYEDLYYGLFAFVGETLVEYDNGKWGLNRGNK